MKTIILLVLLYTVHGHHRHGHLGDSEEDVVKVFDDVPLTEQTDAIVKFKEFLKPTVKVQHIDNDQQDHSKVTVQIPANVQQVVTQVSQHVPVIVNQHLAQMRMASSEPSERVLDAEATNKKCDFKCTRYDMPVCGYNGRCYREFGSQCSLSKYNCLHAQKTFQTVDDTLCSATTTTKCYQGDM